MVSKRKTVLITGGAGFIGSYLCERLIEKGFTVISIDNLITGDMSNIRQLSANKNFKFIKHDISKPIKIGDKLDYVLHFASPASPVDYLKYPIQTLKVGSLGTHNSLGIAKIKNARFLLASTSEIYGDPLIHPQLESYWGNVNPIGPRSVYDEAKRFAEAVTMAYHRKHKIDTKIARIFNTFGPRMRKNDGRAIPNFIFQALRNKPLTVYGSGAQTRSFCYIDDLINGIIKLMDSNINEPINLGNPNEMSIIQLAKLIIRSANSKSKIIFKSLPNDDPKRRRPDITKAKKLLSWQPQVSLDAGLRETISWFRHNDR
ncbi:MAG: SDR family oxidoreductase [Candidatus Omnitrophica bacterium]|nr:SDR family oxidoreductase [Candidatus Omnitrophota bacterium]